MFNVFYGTEKIFNFQKQLYKKEKGKHLVFVIEVYKKKLYDMNV